MHQDDKTLGVMLIGEKESFLIRVLLKKMNESGMEAFFVGADQDTIRENWNRAGIVTYYLDNAEHVNPEIMSYLQIKLAETNRQIILIGEKSDALETMQYIPQHLILETFIRPLDMAKYIKLLSRHQSHLETGENKRMILIVDDDPTYMGVIRDWLRDTYRVAMTNSGMQAIKWLSINKADLILLDYEMPVTSGPQVLEMLRSDPDTSDVPVFFLTGKNDRDSVVQVMGLKPQNYLLKSIGKEELKKELHKFFMKR